MKLLPIDTFMSISPEERLAYLQYVQSTEKYYDAQSRKWLMTVLKHESEDAPKALATEMIGVHLDELKARRLLSHLFRYEAPSSATYGILQGLLITAAIDEQPEVRNWGRQMLKTGDSAPPDAYTSLVELFSATLTDDRQSPFARSHAALALGWMGDRQSIQALINFGTILCERISCKVNSLPDSEHILLERIALALGNAAESIRRSHQTSGAIELLQMLQDPPSADPIPGDAADWAMEQIKGAHQAVTCPHPVTETSAATGSISTSSEIGWSEWFRHFRRALRPHRFSITLATLCAVGVALLISIPKTDAPIAVDVSLLVGGGGTGHPVRGKSGGQSPLIVEDGGVLHSGDHFRIRISPHDAAHIKVLFNDSSGEISLLYSGYIEADATYLVSGGRNGFQLDHNTGMESIYVLAFETPPADFEVRLNRLRLAGIDQLDRVFPNADIHPLRFRHD